MKISIIGVAPPYRGGISLHNALLVKYLSLKHDVECFNFTRQYPDLIFPGKTQFETGKPAVLIESKRILDSINPLSWYKTANQISNQNPDLVIFRAWNSFFSIMFGYIAARIKKNKSTITCMVICDNIYPHEKNFFDEYLMKYFLKKMDLFIVQSSIVEKDLLNLIPNAIYSKIFHPIYNVFGNSIKKNEARKIINISSKYLILYSGLIRSYKGFDILIKSINYLKNRLDDFMVLAIGESYENKEKYDILIKNEKIEDVFIWENRYVPDAEMKYYFSACDVVALPYKSATQSGIIPIAYHFNKPVVVTKVGGLPEMVVNNKTGIIIEPENPIDLADAISENLIGNNFKKMDTNIAHFKNKFTWEAFIEGIEQLAQE